MLFVFKLNPYLFSLFLVRKQLENMNNRKFNHYRFTDRITNRVKNYISNNNLPEKMKNKYAGFIVRDDYLVFEPIDQVVIPPEEIKTRVKEIYDEYGLGSEQKNLYSKVSRRYLGISREQVQEFLKSQEDYQIGKKPLKRIDRKMIYVSDVNKSWYADLLDINPLVTKNKQYRYILVVVDGFSKYVMMVRLKNKEGQWYQR